MADKKINISSVLLDNKKVFISVFSIWVFFSVGSILISSDISISSSPEMKLANMGLFGDSFNVLTSLFTGLAFAGVLVTILLQKTELKETREELKKQTESFELQQIDNKFFQMLNELNNLTNRLKDRKKNTGLEVFENLSISSSEHFIREEGFINKFIFFNDYNDKTFKYYFINLYQVINYIDKNVIPADDYSEQEIKDTEALAKEYINIIRAQQTKKQLKLLFINCIGIIPISGTRYKELVEKYELFEHMQYKDFLSDTSIRHDLLNENLERNLKERFKSEIRTAKKQVIEKQENEKVINSILIQYKEKAFGKNEKLIQKWKEKKELLKQSR
jgi:hypothetical protein